MVNKINHIICEIYDYQMYMYVISESWEEKKRLKEK